MQAFVQTSFLEKYLPVQNTSLPIISVGRVFPFLLLPCHPTITSRATPVDPTQSDPLIDRQHTHATRLILLYQFVDICSKIICEGFFVNTVKNGNLCTKR